MEKFKETGVHPELEAARERAATAVAPLPEKSTARPYVFFDMSVNKQPMGQCQGRLKCGLAHLGWAGCHRDISS